MKLQTQTPRRESKRCSFRQTTLLTCAAFLTAFGGPLVAWGETLTYVTKLTGAGCGDQARLGGAVAVQDLTVIVGSTDQDWGNAQAWGFRYNDGAWRGNQLYHPVDWVPMGGGVAVDGDTAYVGCQYYFVDAPYTDHGAVYMYEHWDLWSGWWKQTGDALQPSSSSYPDSFGGPMVIRGNLLVVSAPGGHGVGSGAVYVFYRKPSGEWEQTATLEADDGTSTDEFGASVAMSEVGNTVLVAVGAPGWKNDDFEETGAVYLFQRVRAGVWAQVARRVPVDPQDGDRFGAAVALEGEDLLVGAPDREREGALYGSVYAFYRRSLHVWSQYDRFDSPDGCRDFGAALAMSGRYAVVGAPGATDGAAYVYKRNADDLWELHQSIAEADGGPSFGQAVAIDVGELGPIGTIYRIVVGDPSDDDEGTMAGAAHVYVLNPMGISFP